jgi:type I restriction enzyme M protein
MTLSQELLFDKLPKKQAFESELWNAADKLRANAKLDPSAYKTPVLALLFLRYAFTQFELARPTVEEKFAAQTSRMKTPIEDMFRTACGFYLPQIARYDYLLQLDETVRASQAVVDAIKAFDEANDHLKDILPTKEFAEIPDDTLRELLVNLGRLQMDNGDQFGKIYEYFLSKFSSLQGQKGGEFYTPQSIVKLIVEVLEPHEGRFYDPACGTGGMFIHSAKFIQKHQSVNNSFICGQEKKGETARLAKLNLTINNLRSDVREVDNSLAAATYTNTEHFKVKGEFDYVMANPPFNVDEIKISEIGSHPLFNTYGLPLSSNKSGNQPKIFSNANYLWVSLFATALNENGRAGFVMANSSSDARGNEMEIRKNMIEEGIVDVMVSVGSNFFYTVTLPVTLWFFDKAKARDPKRKNKTLFIDARKVFNQVTRAHREFTYAQLQNLAAIVWLYRGETDKFIQLKNEYNAAITIWKNGGIEESGEGVLNQGDKYDPLSIYTQKMIKAFNDLGEKIWYWQEAFEKFEPKEGTTSEQCHDWTWAVRDIWTMDDFLDKKHLNEIYKGAEEAVTFAEKVLKPKDDKTFGKADIKIALRALADARKLWVFVADRVAYFEEQVQWLDTRFPDATWCDVEGLCKIADLAEIQEQGYSLNPGRYVGVAIEDDGMTATEFKTFLEEQADTLHALNDAAQELHLGIENDILSLAEAVNTERV